jgi:hypothetical protein
MTQEIIQAAALLKKDFGDSLRVRVVNVVDLLILAASGEHPHALDKAGFDSLFPPQTPVIINYHGYPGQLASLLFNRDHAVGRARFRIHGSSLFAFLPSTLPPFFRRSSASLLFPSLPQVTRRPERLLLPGPCSRSTTALASTLPRTLSPSVRPLPFPLPLPSSLSNPSSLAQSPPTTTSTATSPPRSVPASPLSLRRRTRRSLSTVTAPSSAASTLRRRSRTRLRLVRFLLLLSSKEGWRSA